ncbi:MAG: GntR family transcriptional regulator [Anaerolineales bacterium]
MSFNLDANSKVPLYEQLHHRLRTLILAGTLRTGETLPSERNLAAKYGISRQTVRKALQMLLQEGLIYTRPGAGIFVAPRRKHSSLKLLGFAEEMEGYGLVYTTRVLRRETIEADRTIAAQLALRMGTKVHVLERLRLLNDFLPVGIALTYTPYDCCPHLLEHDFSKFSLYTILEQELHVQLAHAEQTVSARLATPRECELMQLESPAALLTLERLTFDTHEQRVEYALTAYRPDRYPIALSLSRT